MKRRRREAKRFPKFATKAIGRRSRESVGDNHSFDHVSQHGDEWSAAEFDRDRGPAGVAPQRTINPHDARWATKARPDHPPTLRFTSEAACRLGEVDRGTGLHSRIMAKGCRKVS